VIEKTVLLLSITEAKNLSDELNPELKRSVLAEPAAKRKLSLPVFLVQNDSDQVVPEPADAGVRLRYAESAELNRTDLDTSLNPPPAAVDVNKRVLEPPKLDISNQTPETAAIKLATIVVDEAA